MKVTLTCWFMFDRHVFAKVEGTAEQCKAKLIKLHQEDKWCGLHGRWSQNGTELKIPIWQPDYKKGDENISELIKSVEDAFAMVDPVKAQIEFFKKQSRLGV